MFLNAYKRFIKIINSYEASSIHLKCKNVSCQKKHLLFKRQTPFPIHNFTVYDRIASTFVYVVHCVFPPISLVFTSLAPFVVEYRV